VLQNNSAMTTPPSPFAEDDLLWRQLKTIPAFRAVLRAVESRFYYAVDLPGPTLDVGCGDGHFAQMTFNRRIEAGIDPWWGPLQKAERSAAYDLVLQGMGDRLPFPDGHFASAFSNSVLEHIPDVQAVLNETSRVLQRNGRFLITMPSHHFTEWLGGAQFCERLNLPGLADQYRWGFNHISRHVHTDEPEAWSARLAAAGLAVERWQYYFSPQALHALEIGHAQGLPAAVMHALTGHWILAPWESSLAVTERWLRPFYEEEAGEQGAYLLIVARKVSDSPIEATLPPARPFMVAELETAVRQHHLAREDEPQISQISQIEDLQSAISAEDLTQRHKDAESESAENRQSSIINLQSPISFDIIAVLLLLLALASAFIGQRLVAGATADLWAGPRWFLFSFGLLFLFAWREGVIGGLGGLNRRLPRLERPSIPRRRYGYFGGLLLVFAAYRFASGGSWPAWITLGLWLAGSAVGFYALSNVSPAAVGGFSKSPDERFGKSFYVVGGAVVLFLVALGLRVIGLTSHPFILNGLEASIGLDVLAVADGLARNPFATGWLTNPILPYYLMAWPVKLLGPSVLSIRLLAPLIGALTVVAVYWFGAKLWRFEVGLAAAVLLAGSHFHLHYSRLGLTNVWDGLFLLLALGFVGLAWRGETLRVFGKPLGSRRVWLLAGLFIGLNAYLFTASRLLPPTLFVLGLLAWLFDRDRLRGQARHILAALLLAGLVALPQVLYYIGHPGIFMERFLTYSPVAGQADWLAREATAVGGETAVWARQAGRALLAFNANLDFSPAYRPGVPLLSAIPAMLFALGVMVALLRPRQTQAALLLVPIALALLFGGALLIETPSSHRLVVVAPLVSLLAALGLVQIADWAMGLSGEKEDNRRWLLPALLILTLLVAVGEMWFYNGRYRQSYSFGDRNTEIANGVADYLQQLDGESWQAYFFGPPSMYVGFPTIPFLAREFRAGSNLFDVDPSPEEVVATLPAIAAENLAFIFLPERVGEMVTVQARFENGRVYSFPGQHANPLFYVYEVDREE
jgi:SAM-dependent methyltransferase/4-amino-4-deoxy-L-arabinose transferase-like glycosyltransferase